MAADIFIGYKAKIARNNKIATWLHKLILNFGIHILNFMRPLLLLFSLFGACLAVTSCASHSEEDHDHNHDEEQHHGSTEIVLEPAQASSFGIEFETVVPGEFHNVIKTSGEIDASSADLYRVSAKKNGIITLSPGITVGSKVKAGERIGNLSLEGVQGGDLSQAAKANLQAAKAEYDRLKPLHEEGLVTTSVFREAERTYREAEALAGKGNTGGNMVLTSPTEGTILDLYVRSGEYVEVGAPVATVGKNETMVLKADYPSREAKFLTQLETANFIPEGSSEILKLSDLNGKKISGNSAANVSNGYIPVYFSFIGNPSAIPGGYAEVFLIGATRTGVISVPREALIEIQGNKYIYVREDEHGYEKRLVKTGASDGDRVEITEGLNEGEEIVSKGASVLRMAEVSAIAPPSHNHNH